MSYRAAYKPILFLVGRYNYYSCIVMKLIFPNCRVDKRKVNQSGWKYFPITNPFFFKPSLIFGDDFVQILVGKEVGTHRSPGLKEELLAQTLRKQ
jgi:hypothetical protein